MPTFVDDQILERMQRRSFLPPQVAVEELVTNPHNPAGRVAEGQALDELVASLRAVGVLQPWVVVSREEWVEAHPADTLPDSAKFVVWAGNRRREAARRAGLEGVPVVSRPGLAATDAVTMMHENSVRLEPTPVEDAEVIALAMQQTGLGVREVAAHRGVTASYISKRLALLELPVSVRDAIQQGLITARAAYESKDEPQEAQAVAAAELLANPETGQYPSWEGRIHEVVGRSRRAAAEVAARAAADSMGGRFVPESDLRSFFGSREPMWKAQVRDPEAIEAAAQAGSLIVSTGYNHEAIYFDPAITRDDAAMRKAAKAAAKAERNARLDALVKVAAVEPSVSEWSEFIAVFLLNGGRIDAAARPVLDELTRRGVDVPNVERVNLWENPITETRASRRACWIAALAWSEADWAARWDLDTPLSQRSPLVSAYLQLLAKHGGYHALNGGE
jgi:ParB/RepB/Spo0J family partition protein